MAIKRVTLQDIADVCGLSRNTVSKIFNGRGAVSEATKAFVFQKAKELGFLQVPNLSIEQEISDVTTSTISQSIAVLSHLNPLNHSFGSFFIKSFSDQICRSGYTVQLYELSNEEIKNKSLPPHISLEKTAGILCIELFDKDFLQNICNYGIPVLIVDGFCNSNRSLLKCDFISMENIASSIELTNKMISNGAKSIGFIGDFNHCNSFNERWNGYKIALQEAEINLDKNICITENDALPYGDINWLIKRIKEMPYIPDGFFCVNDFHAIHLISALKELGIDVPTKVMVTGFDDSPESKVISPRLSTATIPGSDIGCLAAEMLISRINFPNRAFVFNYVKTTPVFRESSK